MRGVASGKLVGAKNILGYLHTRGRGGDGCVSVHRLTGGTVSDGEESREEALAKRARKFLARKGVRRGGKLGDHHNQCCWWGGDLGGGGFRYAETENKVGLMIGGRVVERR